MKPLVPCLLARTFFRELKHHFDLVDCSAFWNLEFISLLNSMINVINAVVKFGGNSIFVRKSQNIKTLRIKDERKVEALEFRYGRKRFSYKGISSPL